MAAKTATKKPARKPARRKPIIHPFDQAYNVDTSGLIASARLASGQTNDAHITAYYGVAPSIFDGLIARWLNETAPPYDIDRYTFIDIGAGKGRAMLLASQMPFREVIGVELNPSIAAIAQSNITQWTAHEPHLSPIRLLHQDATVFHFPPGPCLAFLFHPFESPVMKRFLRSIETQFARRANKLDLLYVNAEHALVFDRNPAFTRKWFGNVPMSGPDHVADLAAIAQQKSYGSTGDEECAIYRYTGRTKTEP